MRQGGTAAEVRQGMFPVCPAESPLFHYNSLISVTDTLLCLRRMSGYFLSKSQRDILTLANSPGLSFLQAKMIKIFKNLKNKRIGPSFRA